MYTRSVTRAVGALLTAMTVIACQLSSASAAGTAGGARTVLTPVVTTGAGFCPLRSDNGKRTLCAFDIHVSQLSQYGSFVTCLDCGPGRWGDWSKVGSGWQAKAAKPISPHATVLLLLTKPGHIGIYRLYRPVRVNTRGAELQLYRRGCIAADVPAATVYASFHHLVRDLPTVACARPRGAATIYTAGLNELSTSTVSHALVYGHAPGSAWLTVAQTTDGGCKSDPLGFSRAQRHSPIWFTWHVKGEYAVGLYTHATIPDGRFCIYLQAGGQYEHFADGWVVQWTYNDYASGDVVTGPASTSLTTPGAATITLSGDAPRTETLESYDSLTPCPEYSEYLQSTAFGASTMQVSGAFTETFTTATFSQSGYVCNYLHHNGFTVALATDQVSVAGTQLKVQSDYAETADAAITPVSDPVGNAGTTGEAIAAGQTVYVRCILNGMGLAPFDPIWYELASTPWSDAFYAPAYAFYNNGQSSGAVSGGKRWDLAVPFCNAA